MYLVSFEYRSSAPVQVVDIALLDECIYYVNVGNATHTVSYSCFGGYDAEEVGPG